MPEYCRIDLSLLYFDNFACVVPSTSPSNSLHSHFDKYRPRYLHLLSSSTYLLLGLRDPESFSHPSSATSCCKSLMAWAGLARNFNLPLYLIPIHPLQNVKKVIVPAVTSNKLTYADWMLHGLPDDNVCPTQAEVEVLYVWLRTMLARRPRQTLLDRLGINWGYPIWCTSFACQTSTY